MAFSKLNKCKLVMGALIINSGISTSGGSNEGPTMPKNLKNCHSPLRGLSLQVVSCCK